MRKPEIGEHLDRDRTEKMMRQNMGEVQHATRPRVRSLGDKLSWLIAMGTGVTVAWRSFQAGRDMKRADEAPTAASALRSPNKVAVAAKGTKWDETNARQRAQEAKQRAQNGKATVRRDNSRRDAGSQTNDRDTTTQATPAEKVPSGFGNILKELWKRFNDDEVMTRAYALSFIAMLTLVPLLLFALAAAGFVIHNPQQAQDMVRRMVGSLLPGQQGSQAANEFIAKTNIAASAQTLMNNKWYAAITGVISLLWAATGLFVAASDPMNKAWDIKETRSFIALRLVAFGVFIGTVVFFAASLFVTAGAHGVLASIGIPDRLPPFVAVLVNALFILLAVAINAILFALIYRFLPNVQVTWKAAFVGGAIVGVFWEIFKQGFAFYLAHFANMNKMYGAFGGIFLLITWISYSCIILLAGAILCKMYHEHKEEGGITERPSVAKT